MRWLNNLVWSVLLIAIVCILCYAWFSPRKGKIQQPSYKELIIHIDSLNNELEVIKQERDALYELIDSSQAKVEVIENWYEKELVNITNQPIASDVVFFTEYLSEAGK